MGYTAQGAAAEINEISDEVREVYGSMAAEKLNWRESEGSWSVAQCLEHLNRTNAMYLNDLSAISAGKRKVSFWENWSPFSGMFGRWLIAAMKNDAKKVKTPLAQAVPPSDVPEGIVEKFCDGQVRLARVISAIEADPAKVIVTSPFASFITYTLRDAFAVMVEHEKRHIRQALRVTQANGFPGGIDAEGNARFWRE